jgi:hypothetical protein
MLETIDYVLIVLAGFCAFALIVILSLGRPPRNHEVTPKKNRVERRLTVVSKNLRRER